MIICTARPDIKADILVMDPPWYLDYMQPFLLVASRMIKMRGIVIISFPDVGTRPGIIGEWKTLTDWCKTIGLHLIDVRPSYLPYTSPLFERNALRAEGIGNVQSEWRCGNLVAFRSEYETASLAFLTVPREEHWGEYSIERVRIKVRGNLDVAFRDPTLRSIVENDILPSVSRRHPDREKVDVWTSGNRVFSCCGKNILCLVLSAINSNRSVRSHVENSIDRMITDKEKNALDKTVAQIKKLIKTEKDDMYRYYQG